MEKLKFLNFIILSAFSLFLLACSPSPEEISNDVKSSLQQTLSNDEDFIKYNLIVGDINLINIEGNKYRAYADVFWDGKKHQIPLDVYVKTEGTNYQAMWEAQPGAFGFIAKKELAEAFDEIDAEMAQANVEFYNNMEQLQTEIDNWNYDVNNEITQHTQNVMQEVQSATDQAIVNEIF